MITLVLGRGVKPLLWRYCAGANPEEPAADGSVPLHLAAASGRDEAVWALLAAGAELDAADLDGTTVLKVAARRGSQIGRASCRERV